VPQEVQLVFTKCVLQIALSHFVEPDLTQNKASDTKITSDCNSNSL